ncbi:molybdopterin-containing oxidoreductase family protein [Nitrospira sp. Nam80]
MDIKRRTFIQALGLAATGSLLPGCGREVGRLVPYVLPDDEIVPGVADWYASTCRECHAGCGITVRVMEGRAKKIEGNPGHPVNRGKLCARGQAALQRLYNPDRLTGPLGRTGSRLTGDWTSITWDDAFGTLSERLRANGADTIMLSRPLSGTLAWLVSSFMRAIGGRLFFYEPGADLPVRTAARDAFGIEAWPTYDVADSDYVLSFGAPFLEQWLSPVSYGIAYGEMRQGRPATRGRLVHIEPRLSLTAASADRWVPVRPGTEGLAALGIGQVLFNEGRSALSGTQRRAYEGFYAGIPLDQVAATTDIPRDQLIRIAREFATAAAPLAMGGGPACAHTNGTDTMLAIHSLNAIIGNLGQPGGLRFYRPPLFDTGPPVPWLIERRLAQWAEGAENGRPPAVWLLNDVNPLFTMPLSIPVRRLFERAEYRASFSSFLDESTEMADLILPDHASLESWGDHIPPVSSAAQVVSLLQPAVSPLYDTRALGDTILHIASHLGVPGFSSKDFPSLIQERWRHHFGGESRNTDDARFESAWIGFLQQGGWWNSAAPDMEPAQSAPPPRYEAAHFDGDQQEFPFYLLPYPSMSLGYGRDANLPWLQELPDTLTTAMWGSWVEVNPVTARSLGITPGDMVRIHSRHGSLDVPALIVPGIRPDAIAVPIGQGHADYGRYASRRGINPISILAPLFDHRSGSLATAGTRVRIETTTAKGPLVLLERPGMEPSPALLSIQRSRPGA